MDKNEIVTSAQRAIAASAVFDGMPPHLAERLAKSARFESYDEPTIVIRAGGSTEFVRYVLHGYGFLQAESETGKELNLVRLGRGNWFGWVIVFGSIKVNTDHVAAAGTQYLAFPKDVMIQAASEWPQLFLNVFQQTGRLIGKILNWSQTVHLSDGDTRIARLLIQLLPSAHAGAQCEIACSQEELARSFGIGRQALNRRLGELEGRGLIERGYGKLLIPDVAALADYAA